MTTLIIIRGNSGSGKTTLAKQLRRRFTNSLLISQDVIRREILQVDDHAGNLSINLMNTLLEFGRLNVDVVIIEGILRRDVYAEMLVHQAALFHNVIPIYYNLSLSETLNRHKTKSAIDFTDKDVKRWYRANDYLGIEDEIIFDHAVTVEMAIYDIIEHMNKF